MNIIHAILAVDTEALYENSFQEAKLILESNNKQRTIRVVRKESNLSGQIYVEYQISKTKFELPLYGDDMRMYPPSIRRRQLESALKIRSEINEIASIASLSVYRIGGDIDPEMRERNFRRNSSTVDIRLTSLIQLLTQYQLELSNIARTLSTNLQKDVLTSLLFTDEKTKQYGYDINFDANIERSKLTSAYRQLGLIGSDTNKKIQEHIKNVENSIKALNNGRTEENIALLSALEAFKLTRTITEKSLATEEKIKKIYRPLDFFIETLRDFIPDKDFEFKDGELLVKNDGAIPFAKLSSGEKQLLILFVEALLQRQRPYIFMADEPELSLHISWQRKIIPAIMALNPNAQIIVATHSPEVAGKFREKTLNMEKILHV